MVLAFAFSDSADLAQRRARRVGERAKEGAAALCSWLLRRLRVNKSITKLNEGEIR
jgi:hypothetical protein